ncbi:1,6-anhydro-N-acetylmuramyl-L-alanine amidase AmpD [Roseateles sp. BYS180W]|uniref:1,6-anhydro-N-acetylmuramyl-L-alanine amidase AmpD n=1 Tax=Roseateles rivi TaxID=3299028 RepID=A0ABW7FW99_9BURK
MTTEAALFEPCSGSHWSEGWWHAARRLESPHMDARPDGVSVDLVVLHAISLPPGQYGGPQIEQLFMGVLDTQAHPATAGLQGVRVSAHFLIQRCGALTQFVSCDARAWHAGASSFQGRERCNDYSIGIELEGLDGALFTPAQYASLARLLKALAQRYPIAAVQGHEHIAPGRKRDPGPGFDWARAAQGCPLDWQWPV